MNTIVWQQKALRQLRKIRNVAIQERIFRDIQLLKHFPNCANVQHLTNHTYEYRLRVGDYRVFFDFAQGEVRVISIQEVRKRNEHTY